MLEIYPWVVASLCVAVLFVLDTLWPDSIKHRWIIWGSVLSVMAVTVVYRAFFQYYVWHTNTATDFLLPPYTPITYFLAYIMRRFVSPYMLSFFAGILVWIVMRWLNKKYQDRFFYEKELVIVPAALFLVGYPGLIVYVLFSLGVFMGLSIFRTIFFSKTTTTSLRYLWLPIAMCVILINELVLSQTMWWKLLKL